MRGKSRSAPSRSGAETRLAPRLPENSLDIAAGNKPGVARSRGNPRLAVAVLWVRSER